MLQHNMHIFKFNEMHTSPFSDGIITYSNIRLVLDNKTFEHTNLEGCSARGMITNS